MRQPLNDRRCCPFPIKRALCRCESRELGWKPGSRMFADNSGTASLVTVHPGADGNTPTPPAVSVVTNSLRQAASLLSQWFVS